MSGEPTGSGPDETGDGSGAEDRTRGLRQPRRPLPRSRPRMVVRIGPDDVGERVSVRFRLPQPEPGEPAESEAVGWLRAWRDGALTIERRGGTHAVIDEGDLIAGRTVPPPPPRRRPR